MANTKDERLRGSQKEGMTSALKTQKSAQTTENCKNEDGKTQLAYPENYTEQMRNAEQILKKKEHMESCLKLLKFVADSELTLTQVNGQRRLGPPPRWIGPPPGPKCEIFVGNIPRNYYEPELVMIFSTVGQIYELRLMMDFSGTNRGFCFVMYTTEEEAARAVRELDQYETYPGKRIGVVASTNNCRLYIKSVPQNVDSKAIVKRIYQITDDVDNVAVYRKLDGAIAYVLVSYKTHRGAAMGRRRLVPEAATLFNNCEINVEWANPNMIPSNVFEECGTCDERGNVTITKTFIDTVRIKKPVPRSRCNRSTDKRPNAMANQRVLKPPIIDPTIRKYRAIKAAPETARKGPQQSSNHCTQKCQLENWMCSQCSMTDAARNENKMKENSAQAWDINGNLRNTVDQSLSQEDFKNYFQDQSNAILPSISTYLSKGKRPRSLRVNDLQHRSGEAFWKQNGHDTCPTNSLDSYDPFKYNIDCLSLFRNNGSVNVGRNSPMYPAPKVSEMKENDKNCINYDHGRELQTSTGSNLKNLPNFSHAPNNHGHLANGLQYTNYYQNLPINGVGQNSVPCLQISNQFSGQYNVQSVRRAMVQQGARPEHFPQRFLLNNVKPVIMDQNFGYIAETLANQAPSCETRRVLGSFNGFWSNLKYLNNYRMFNNCQNAQGAARYEDLINHGSPLNPLSNVDNTFVQGSNLKPLAYSKEDAFAMQNKQQFGETFQGDGKCCKRPILKGSSNNIRVNY